MSDQRDDGGNGTWFEPLSDNPNEFFTAEEDRVVEAAMSILDAEGPLSQAALEDRMGQLGFDPLDLPQDWPFVLGTITLRDQRVATLAALADGRGFTHRLTALEADERRLATSPDLDLYVAFMPPSPALAGDGELELKYWSLRPDPQRPSSMFGPVGWLGDATAGDLLEVSMHAGVVAIAVVDPAVIDAVENQRVAGLLRDTWDAMDGLNAWGGPVDGPELLSATIARHPSAFQRPVEPVQELLRAVGLIEDMCAIVAADGAPGDEELVDFGDDEAVQGYRDWLTQTYGLDQPGIKALGVAVTALELLDMDPTPTMGPPEDMAPLVVPALSVQPGVAPALADSAFAGDARRLADLQQIADMCQAIATGTKRAPVRLLLARCAEVRGDALAAEAALQAALDADPNYGPAHEELADYRQDRGDIQGAMRHLRRANLPDGDPRLADLADSQPAGANVGRNSPCPCGSGRKYKQCHLGAPASLTDRVPALLRKATRFSRRPHLGTRLMPLVEALAGDATDVERLEDALAHPLITSLALFDDGLLADFATQRGPLLPADERKLLAAWADRRQSAFEIRSVGPGQRIDLLDLRSQELIVVPDGRDPDATGPDEQVGDTLLARALPIGDSWYLAMALRLPTSGQASLLALLETDPWAVEICSWVAGFNAAELRTTEGEPVVYCRATYEISAAVAATAALHAELTSMESHQVGDFVDLDGELWLRGTVTVTNQTMVISANSEARLERLHARALACVPDAVERDQQRRPAAPVQPQPNGPSDSSARYPRKNR